MLLRWVLAVCAVGVVRAETMGPWEGLLMAIVKVSKLVGWLMLALIRGREFFDPAIFWEFLVYERELWMMMKEGEFWI